MRSMPSIIDAGGAAPATMALHARGQALLHLVRRVHQHAVHDGRAAVMRHAVRA